jgi:hypothetical protein
VETAEKEVDEAEKELNNSSTANRQSCARTTHQ